MTYRGSLQSSVHCWPSRHILQIGVSVHDDGVRSQIADVLRSQRIHASASKQGSSAPFGRLECALTYRDVQPQRFAAGCSTESRLSRNQNRCSASVSAMATLGRGRGGCESARER